MTSALLVLLLFLFQAAAPAPPPLTTPTPTPVPVPAQIELTVEAYPAPGRPFAAGDFTVLEDGAPRRLAAVSQPAPTSSPWRLLIYFDRVLVSSRTMRAAAAALAARAGELAALGTVEVVLAEPEPTRVLAPTRNAYAIDEALSRIALTGEGLDGLRAIRRRYREPLHGATGVNGADADVPDAEQGTRDERADAADAAAAAVEEEIRLVRRQADNLAGWLASNETGRSVEAQRALFLVADGFDADPREFYRLAAAPAAITAPAAPAGAAAGAATGGPGLAGAADELARTVAALGWTALALPLFDEQLPDLQRWSGGRFGVTLPGEAEKREKERQRKAAAEPPLLLRPVEPLQQLAEATGGEVLGRAATLADAVLRLRSAVLLRYEAPARAADGRLHAVEVRGAAPIAPKLTVRARRFDATGTPGEVAALRARRLLEGEGEAGALTLTSAVQLAAAPAAPSVPAPPGGPSAVPAPAAPSAIAPRSTLEVRLDPAGLPPGATAAALALRLTVASAAGAGSLAQRPLTAADLESGEPWTYRVDLPLPFPAGANAEDERLAVVVDEPAGGAWGGELAAVVTPSGAEEGASLLPAPPAPGTAAPARPPAGGPVSGPRVRILRPAAGKASGLVDVEAEVRVPAENRVARVEFFWNDELAATLYQPPFRHRVPVPAGRPGYLRVAAHLDDGTIAEDAVPVNTAELGERLDVQLVQLYVVVTDRAGRPVRGLAKGDFQVLQDGRAQRLASFDDAADLPLTLGLAIDSSASMFLKLPDVVAAARSLLAHGLGRRDSALLVDFSTHPRLVAPATHDLPSLSAALDTLRPDGDTGLWQAIDFSLAELQRVSGRKALVLYSDGLEQNDSFPYRAALKRARESGVPLYLIVTDAQAARTGNVLYLGRSYAARLDRLAAAAGGKIYFVRPDQDLAAVYREILAELRSQYVLSYYPKDPATDTWRKVKVEVAKKGLTARTLSGYYAGR